jgi:beta-glucosidase
VTESGLPGAIEQVGAFESTYMPRHDVDVTETTRHDVRWREDLALLGACGVRRVRYPVRWHRVERTGGVLDWRATDEVMEHLSDGGFEPIVDLCHHTSYPRWIRSFADPAFGPAYLRFVAAFAERYPEVGAYTLFNEPFTTFLLCGQEGLWPPYHRGLSGMLDLARNVLPAVARASRLLREVRPGARHVYVEACERHTSAGRRGDAMAAYANDRRFFFTDLFVGRQVDPGPGRPFVADVLRAGGEDLLGMEPGHVDVLGLDYYAHNQWHWSGAHRGTTLSPSPVPLADVIVEYADRYRLPVMLGETNVRGFASDRATWFKYTLEQCERARDAGVALDGYCWFPFIDSCDWDSLLARCDGRVDPVGVYWLDPGADLARRPSEMSEAYTMAARGLPSTALPAYALRPPVSERLRGYLPHMDHWEWQPAPGAPAPVEPPARRAELRIP